MQVIMIPERKPEYNLRVLKVDDGLFESAAKDFKSEFDKDPFVSDYYLEKLLRKVWDKAYSLGLKHMDQMHGKIDSLQ